MTGVEATAPGLGFEGLVNARDLGGIPVADAAMVRPGVLYRSETPELMTSADVVRARDELGLRRTIDLRGGRGRPYPLGRDGRRVAVDFFELVGDHADGDDDFLPSLVGGGGAPVARVLELVVTAGGPCLLHCHTGKDRTGFVAAMILAMLGADDEHIVADYERSIPVYEPLMTNLRAAGIGVPEEAPAFARRPPSPVGIRAMLNRVRSGWPTPRDYLLSQGVDPGLLGRAVELLVDPGPTSPV